jgi:hypothetical protein
VAQTCGNHLGLGLVSIADVEDTQIASLGLLHGQYGPSSVMLHKEVEYDSSRELNMRYL